MRSISGRSTVMPSRCPTRSGRKKIVRSSIGAGQRSSGGSRTSPPATATISSIARRNASGMPGHVDAALEPVARLARQLERAAGAADPRRLEKGALEHEVSRGGRHFGFGASHDARDDRRPLGVADGGHLRCERAPHPVQRDDLLVGARPPDDHGRAAQLGQIERVQRLVQLEQDVVGRVDDVVDRPLPDARESLGEPRGALVDPNAANDRGHVAGATFGVLETDLDAVDGTTGGKAGRREVRWPPPALPPSRLVSPAASPPPRATPPALAPRPCGTAGRGGSRSPRSRPDGRRWERRRETVCRGPRRCRAA